MDSIYRFLNDIATFTSETHPVFIFGYNLCKKLYEDNTKPSEILYFSNYYKTTYQQGCIDYHASSQKYIYPVQPPSSTTTASQLGVVTPTITVIEIYYKWTTKPSSDFSDTSFIFFVDNSAVDEFNNSLNQFYQYINAHLSQFVSDHISQQGDPGYVCKADFRSNVPLQMIKDAMNQTDLFLIEAIDRLFHSSITKPITETPSPISDGASTAETKGLSAYAMTLIIIVVVIVVIAGLYMFFSSPNRNPYVRPYGVQQSYYNRPVAPLSYYPM